MFLIEESTSTMNQLFGIDWILSYTKKMCLLENFVLLNSNRVPVEDYSLKIEDFLKDLFLNIFTNHIHFKIEYSAVKMRAYTSLDAYYQEVCRWIHYLYTLNNLKVNVFIHNFT